MTAADAHLVEHWARSPKVAGSVPAGGKLSFSPLEFLDTYIVITTNNIPCTFLGFLAC